MSALASASRTALRFANPPLAFCTAGPVRTVAPTVGLARLALVNSSPASPSPLLSSSSRVSPPRTARYATAASAPAGQQITWNDFFRFRQERKTAERVGGILGGIAGFVGGTYYFGTLFLDFDPTEMVFGVLDPAIAYTLGAMAAGAAGAAAGIFAGGAMWALVRRSAQASLKAREKDFFERIKKNRVVPTAQAVGNTAPDFYGEKIKDVRGYRKWIRAQRKVRAARPLSIDCE
ncbi:mitochondrial import protein Pam17-domain-containing protein [Hyaloraphidium curvatum]|nr:mitochondrial import protein Pam17-domain-containing protein [Hyaloraphidium curvatum]